VFPSKCSAGGEESRRDPQAFGSPSSPPKQGGLLEALSSPKAMFFAFRSLPFCSSSFRSRWSSPLGLVQGGQGSSWSSSMSRVVGLGFVACGLVVSALWLVVALCFMFVPLFFFVFSLCLS
jgi:hypothetical protein